MVDNSKIQQHWGKTKTLLLITLVIWFILSYVIQLFVVSLNEISFLGFPLGYYMAAQGCLFLYVVILFMFARSQNKIDEEHGLAEN